jgi:hypothetical protein
MMIFYENTIYSLVTAYFFASLIYSMGDAVPLLLGLSESITLLILTHYNEYLKRSHARKRS